MSPEGGGHVWRGARGMLTARGTTGLGHHQAGRHKGKNCKCGTSYLVLAPPEQ